MKPLAATVLVVFCAAPALAADPGANGDLSQETCAYPAAALAAKAQGASLLGYTGSAKGTLEAIKLLSSSGNGDLDRAALACVARWRFDPALPLGARLIGPGRLNIAWKIEGSNALGRRAAIPHSCQPDYPPAALAAQASGVTRVRFTITAEGRVRDPGVETSSGNADLDAAALECVRFWRYRPATKSGQPVEVSWRADIKWELYDPPVPEE